MTAPDQLHSRFLSMLPRLEAHANWYFREIRCPAKKADRIADTIALAWKWFVELESRGKNALNFSILLGAFAARAVHHGRRVQGMERTREVMNTRTQKRVRFRVERLPGLSTSGKSVFAEALVDNTVTPPPMRRHFASIFPRWLRALPDRDRQLALTLMIGEGRLTRANNPGEPGRVSQLRRELADDWAQFHGEAPRHRLNQGRFSAWSPPLFHARESWPSVVAR